MSSSLPRPRVVRNSQNTQITYDLPHRIHTSIVYPLQSSNGSSVILYGHENGVTVLWRGGRPFKQTQSNKDAPRKTNGAENAVISLDSDDEDASASRYEDKPEFEDEEEEIDPLQPFPAILQSLDLCLGVEVTHLAVLPASMMNPNLQLPKGFEDIRHKIVFTAACSDNYLRLITLPLAPPSHASKSRSDFRKHPFNTVVGHGSWGERVTRLNGHQRSAGGVSMTLNLANNDTDSVKAGTKLPVLADASIIVASHSREATGLLLVFRVPLKSHFEQLEPYQTVYLPSPATCISFNTSSSAPRSSHLLVAESTGVCRIYDYSLLSRSSDDSQNFTSLQGSWLLSLYPGFKSRKNDTSVAKKHGSPSGYGRKTVIDAKWVSGGRAVIVLLNDGEWVVWDIEGARPGASQGLLGGEGMKGGSRSEYSLSGYIESGSKLRSGPLQPAGSNFAPMTPSTRKLAEPFGSRQHNGPFRGQISVLELPTSSSTIQSDNSITFWFGETFAVIPSLSKYWPSHQTGASNPFAGTSGGRIIKLDAIDLQGERCSGITQIPKFQRSAGLQSDILVSGEHRLTILLIERQTRQPQFRSSGRLALMEKSTNGGELEDINRALELMENGSKMELF